MQYCSLQHRTLLPSAVASTTGCCFFLAPSLLLSGVISPLISSSILGIYQPGEFIVQCYVFLPFYTFHGVLDLGCLNTAFQHHPCPFLSRPQAKKVNKRIKSREGSPLLMSTGSSKLTNLEPCQEPSLWPHPLTTEKTQAFIYPFGLPSQTGLGVCPVIPGKSHYMSNKPFHTVFVHVWCPQSPYQNQFWFYRNSAHPLHRQQQNSSIMIEDNKKPCKT